LPNVNKNPGCNAWKYDSETDSYVAYADTTLKAVS
jgi:hypothetical protein